MKTTLSLAALALAALPLPAALADGPADRGARGGGAERVERERPAHAGGREGRGGPALVARGTIGALDVAAGRFTLELTGGNRPLRRVADGAGELTVTLDLEREIDGFTTRITAAGRGRAGVGDLAVGDRVVVSWRAPRGVSADALAALEARRVVVRAGARPVEEEPAA